MSTIKELAAHLGVSVSTVSVVLRGEAQQRKISQSTQDKIWQAAHEMGYMPNISARRLRNPAEDPNLVIAIFWASDFRAPMMIRFLRGVQKEILGTPNKYEIIIHPYKNNELNKEKSLRELSMFNAAIVCNASEVDMEFLNKTSFHLPIVLYNRHSEKFCTVTVNDISLGSIPAEIFRARGHRKMAVLTSGSAFTGMNVRTRSFLDTGEKIGLIKAAVIEQDNSMAGGYLGAKMLCEMADMPDCLFCASDAMAIGALRAFHEANIKIPQEIELISVGNGDKEQEEYSYPSLSVVHIPMEKMAQSCFQLLMDLIDRKVLPPHSIELPVDYIQRESCGGIE